MSSRNATEPTAADRSTYTQLLGLILRALGGPEALAHTGPGLTYNDALATLDAHLKTPAMWQALSSELEALHEAPESTPLQKAQCKEALQVLKGLHKVREQAPDAFARLAPDPIDIEDLAQYLKPMLEDPIGPETYVISHWVLDYLGSTDAVAKYAEAKTGIPVTVEVWEARATEVLPAARVDARLCGVPFKYRPTEHRWLVVARQTRK